MDARRGGRDRRDTLAVQDEGNQAAPQAIPFEVKESTEEASEPMAKFVPRAMRIMKPDLVRYGYTKGCRKCEMMRRGDNSQPTLGHSPDCRRRIEAEVRKEDSPQRRRLEEGRCESLRAHREADRGAGPRHEEDPQHQ